MEIIIKNRTYKVTTTGLKNVAYKLSDGKLELTGVRSQNNTDVIIVMDKRSNRIGFFSESRMVELVAINA